MPRGRPPGSKNKSTLARESLFDNTPVISKQKTQKVYTPNPPQTVSSKVTPTMSKYPKCMCCGNPVSSGFCIAQLTSLTGRAYWHREVVDRIKMCSECAQQFSDAMEKWLLQHGAPKRLGYDKEGQVDV